MSRSKAKKPKSKESTPASSQTLPAPPWSDWQWDEQGQFYYRARKSANGNLISLQWSRSILHIRSRMFRCMAIRIRRDFRRASSSKAGSTTIFLDAFGIDEGGAEGSLCTEEVEVYVRGPENGKWGVRAGSCL